MKGGPSCDQHQTSSLGSTEQCRGRGCQRDLPEGDREKRSPPLGCSSPIMSRMLWWLDTMMAGPSTSKFSSPFTSNLRPKKYLKDLTTVLMILQRRRRGVRQQQGRDAVGARRQGQPCDSLQPHPSVIHPRACPARPVPPT